MFPQPAAEDVTPGVGDDVVAVGGFAEVVARFEVGALVEEAVVGGDEDAAGASLRRVPLPSSHVPHRPIRPGHGQQDSKPSRPRSQGTRHDQYARHDDDDAEAHHPGERVAEEDAREYCGEGEQQHLLVDADAGRCVSSERVDDVVE